MKSQLRLGAHTSIAGGLYRAIERGAEAGCDVVQIFTRSNQQWAVKSLTDEDLAKFAAAQEQTGVRPAMAHGSYLVNLSAATSELREKSYGGLAADYGRSDQLGVPYLVIHPGAHMGQGVERGIELIAQGLDRLCDDFPDGNTVVLLETTAGQGTGIGHRFEQLRDIFGAVAAPERFGICVDTCHVLAAGYDIRTTAGWAAVFDELDRLVGCDQVRAFHVNDSKKELGSRVDRHEHLGRGFLGLEAFHCLVNDERFSGVPMTLETPKKSPADDALNLSILRCLHGISRVGAKARRLAEQPVG